MSAVCRSHPALAFALVVLAPPAAIGAVRVSLRTAEFLERKLMRSGAERAR